MKHKHHIIPKHAGGTDDLSNLIELSIDDHAEAHRILFEKHNRWQDKLAWQALTGQIGSKEIRKIKHAESMKELWNDPKFKLKVSILAKEQVKEQWKDEQFQKLRSESAKNQWKNPEYKEMMSEASRKNWLNDDFRNRKTELVKKQWRSEEYRRMMSENTSKQAKKQWEDPAYIEKMKKANSKRLPCKHCGRLITKRNLSRHQTACIKG